MHSYNHLGLDPNIPNGGDKFYYVMTVRVSHYRSHYSKQAHRTPGLPSPYLLLFVMIHECTPL